MQPRSIQLGGELMAQVIVGDTTESSTRIWVRGDGPSLCTVTLSSPDGRRVPEQTLELTKGTAYTGVAVFKELQSNTAYEVRALFTAGDLLEIRGRARTRATPPDDGLREFSFVLGSCNLSVV